MIKLPSLRQAADLTLTLCALTIVALLAKREFIDTAGPGASAREPSRVENWRDYDVGGSILHEGDSAAVRIIEFSDFQCPYCAVMHSALDSVIARMPGKITVRYRHFPLVEIHPSALAAAIGAACAEQQGRFKPFHDALFTAQAQIGIRPWTEFARIAGIPDTTAFRTCMSDSASRQLVETDVSAATALQLTGTPALLIEGQLISGAVGATVLESIVGSARR